MECWPLDAIFKITRPGLVRGLRPYLNQKCTPELNLRSKCPEQEEHQLKKLLGPSAAYNNYAIALTKMQKLLITLRSFWSLFQMYSDTFLVNFADVFWHVFGHFFKCILRRFWSLLQMFSERLLLTLSDVFWHVFGQFSRCILRRFKSLFQTYSNNHLLTFSDVCGIRHPAFLSLKVQLRLW